LSTRRGYCGCSSKFGVWLSSWSSGCGGGGDLLAYVSLSVLECSRFVEVALVDKLSAKMWL
jgi:hypothetical protein